MCSSRVFVAVLLLQALDTVLARPSEGQTQDGSQSATLLDAILNGCSSTRPQTFATAEEMAGSWCDIVNAGEEQVGSGESCRRLTIIPEEGQVQMTVSELREGHFQTVKNKTFTQIENRSWLSTGPRTRNYFFGFIDGYTLHACGTSIVDGQKYVVKTMTFALCPTPGDVRAADDPRPHVKHCYSQANTD